VFCAYGPATSVAMASKDVCLICDKPFYGKQKCIRCCVCELRYHCNCLKTNVSECNVDASTGKSSFMCDSCVIGSDRALVINNTKKALSTGMDRPVSPVSDKDFLNGQLEAVRLNGVCTMEMVKSLLEMVTKLSLEVQELKGDNTALKLQLRDLRQIYASPTYISTEAASSRHVGSAKTYSDVLSSGGGHPASTTETVSGTHGTASRTSRDVSSSGGGHPASASVSFGPNWHATLPKLPESTAMASGYEAADGSTTVLWKRKGNHPISIPSGVPNPPKRTRTPLIGNKRGSTLTTVPKRVRTKAHFVSRPPLKYSQPMWSSL
jgi:hypothetical protein